MRKDGFVFISHSSRNYETAMEIVNQLESAGIRCYIAPRDIRPGSIYAEEIVNAISSSICVVLIFSRESNSSAYVLKEINSAVNHEARIIPIRIDTTTPSQSIDFYVGEHHWITYINDKDEAISVLTRTLSALARERPCEEEPKKQQERLKPRVLSGSDSEQEGWDARRRVIETIEIDYLTLELAQNDYVMNEEIEGTVEDWLDYASAYPDTCSLLVLGDKLIGYSQVELLTEENFRRVVSGETMITAEMEEFYGFGGEFCCYIVIMPILREHENMNNYLLLFDDLVKKIVRFHDSGGEIAQYAISSYSPLLDKAVEQLGFVYAGKNPAGGKIYVLTAENIKNSRTLKKRYPQLHELY